MTDRADLPPTLSTVAARIREAIPALEAVYAYGSQITGQPHPHSDLDLALLLPRGTTFSPVFLAQLQGDLEAFIGMPVEISILDIDSQIVHSKEVVAGGVKIYIGNHTAVAEFEVQTLARYARLCEDRKPIIEAYTRGDNG